ncbi:MAG: hypothetical protein JOZ07_14515 [Solirubrobacterales bacterium]|nr:hypothetical protein [Solirubrobacterales bacterium]
MRRTLPWWGFGLANLVVVCVLSLGLWYLLVDPHFHVVHDYPEPFDETLFWAIITVVFLGFNLEFHWFDRLPQPLRGVVLILVTVAVAIGLTAVFAAWGRTDPAFSAKVPMGMGYLLPALFVLFGFFTYLTAVINWDHWPWRHLGLKQPWLGIAEIGALTGPTVVLFAFFVLPNLATWAKPGHTDIIDLPTTIGVVYSIIVVAVVTGLLTENWPWRLAGPGGRTAVASLVGNIVLGIGLYFLFRAVVKAFIGAHAAKMLAPMINQYPAELGVCWVFWMIMWSNGFYNWPTGLSVAANYAVRIVVTLALGIGTFFLYYYVLAQHVLHEPVVAGKLAGNALGWMNWMVLMTLFFVVYLGSLGIPGEPEVSADEPERVDEVFDDHSASTGQTVQTR